MNVERQGKTSVIAAAIANAYQHGFAVVIAEKPTPALDSDAHTRER